MLIRLESFKDVDREKLMGVYAQSNGENAEIMYPDEDRAAAVKKVEDGFMDFLRDGFYLREGNVYYVLEEDGEWKSALRLSLIEPGFYYLEALETRPDCRRQGYAAKLINAVLAELKGQGSFIMRDCVSKTNTASLATHKKCGFVIDAEDGYDYLNGGVNERHYGMLYVSD